MGFRSADTDFDGLVYGLGAGLGDALKATCPFMVAYGLKNRDWMATIAATAVFIVFTGYSFTAAVGFAAEHRNTKAAESASAIETHADTRDAQKRVKARLDLLGTARASGEVKADIAAQLKVQTGPRNRTVGEISQDCTLNRLATREACAAIAVLKSELARSEEGERLAAQLFDLNKVLEKRGGEGAKLTSDAQVDVLRRLGRVVQAQLSDKDVGFILAILLALFIELGSGLGLFIATTPWRTTQAVTGIPRESTQQAKSGAVDLYVLDRLEPDPQGEVRFTDLYASYVAWCKGMNARPQSRSSFKSQFSDIAREVGMRNRLRNGQELYQQVRLIKEAL